MRIRRVVGHAPTRPDSPHPGIHLSAPPKPPVNKERVWFKLTRGLIVYSLYEMGTVRASNTIFRYDH
eukprot:1158711-Pelagomonas_calceolata.AAC.16